MVLGGCSAPKPPEPPSLTQGIKLRDLRTPDAAERGMVLPSAVNLEVSTFAVPADKYESAMRAIMPMLVSGPGILRNAADFRANGFVAATGSMRSLDVIGSILGQTGVRSINNKYYAIYDDRANDIEMGPLERPASISYVRGGKAELTTLRHGVLAMRMVIKRTGQSGSACKLMMAPVWKASSEASFVERTSGMSRDIIFDNSAMDVTVQAGDIVVVAPASATRTDRLGQLMMVTTDAKEALLTIVKVTGITQ